MSSTGNAGAWRLKSCLGNSQFQNLTNPDRRRIGVALVLALCLGAPAWAQCSDDTVWIKGDFGVARFSVEIADDDEERAQGLMHRPSMPAASGMLFVYERPRVLSFWMRNTLIELDILFADSTGLVTKIHHRAQPLDETPIAGGASLTHALEINGGLAKMLGITAGARLRHPSFDQSNAAWPC